MRFDAKEYDGLFQLPIGNEILALDLLFFLLLPEMTITAWKVFGMYICMHAHACKRREMIKKAEVSWQDQTIHRSVNEPSTNKVWCTRLSLHLQDPSLLLICAHKDILHPS